MRTHLNDSEERRHYIVKKYSTIDTKIHTLYTGEFKATSKNDSILHNHTFLEIMLISSGSGYVEIENRIYNVKRGDIVLYHPKNMHREWSNDQQSFQALFFSVKFTDQLKLMFLSSNTSCIIETTKDYQFFYVLFKSLVKESHERNTNYLDKIVNCIAKTIILKLLQVSSNSEVNQTNEVVNIIKEYIDSHYLEDIKLDKLYEKIFVSESYASRLFKQYIGTTPMSYIVSKRIEEARSLLLRTNMSISEIANSVGYKDIYYFTKSFKKEIGAAPTYYRKAMRQKN